MTIQERIDCGLIYQYLKEGFKESSIDEISSDYDFLRKYLTGINWYHPNNRVAILKSLNEDKHYELYLFSEKHKYSIVVKPNYIGCVSSCLYEKPMEGWHRGSDLPDGKCTEETFTSILFAILHNELVPYDDGSKKPEHLCGEEGGLDIRMGED